MLADLYDLTQLSIDAAAKHGSGKRARISRPYRRPGSLAVAKPRTVAEMTNVIEELG